MKSTAANRRNFLHQAGMLGGMAFLLLPLKTQRKPLHHNSRNESLRQDLNSG